jgi:hypothetical protein
MNASSILFPAWEKAFVAVVNKRLPEVKDDALIAQMKQFVQEELAHANAHEAFNTRHNLKDFELEQFKKANTIHKKPELKMWLGVMVSIEHLAACISRSILNRWGKKEGKEFNLFKWHSKEELGHKSLAINVWDYLGFPKKDLRKIALANQKYVIGFLISYTIKKVYKDGQLKNWKTWVDLVCWFSFLFINLIIPMLTIYLPNFHPNHVNDDKYLLVAT